MNGDDYVIYYRTDFHSVVRNNMNFSLKKKSVNANDSPIRVQRICPCPYAWELIPLKRR